MPLYFAYCSTLDPEQLSRGTGERVARPLFVASLANHSVLFTRSARYERDILDIRPQAGRSVWGAVFEVSGDGLVRLDEAVGAKLVPPEHRRIPTTVTAHLPDHQTVQTLTGDTIQDGAAVQVQTYEHVEKQDELVPPSPRLLLGIVASAVRWRLPEDYISRLAALPSSDAFTVADIRVGARDGTGIGISHASRHGHLHL